MQAKLYPKLIQDVQLVINGLGKITVLWEEQWLNTLQDLHSGNGFHLHERTNFSLVLLLVCLRHVLVCFFSFSILGHLT